MKAFFKFFITMSAILFPILIGLMYMHDRAVEREHERGMEKIREQMKEARQLDKAIW